MSEGEALLPLLLREDRDAEEEEGPSATEAEAAEEEEKMQPPAVEDVRAEITEPTDTSSEAPPQTLAAFLSARRPRRPRAPQRPMSRESEAELVPVRKGE